MIYESQIFGEGSILKWGFVFKQHADDEDPIYVLIIGESSTLCLDAIGDSFTAHQWAAKAICDSYSAVGEPGGPLGVIEAGIERYANHTPGTWPGPVATGDYLEQADGEMFVNLNGSRAKLADVESLDSLIGQLNAIRRNVYGSVLRLDSETQLAGEPENSM